MGRAVPIGADGGDVHEPSRAGLARRACHRARALDVDGIEGLGAPADEHADRVDDDVGALRCALDRQGIARLACTAWICPTRPMGCRWPARSGRRTAARTRQPRVASALTVCRPTNPEPPKTTASPPCGSLKSIALDPFPYLPVRGEQCTLAALCEDRRRSVRRIDNTAPCSYLMRLKPRACPGGGIGRRCFRY